MIIRLTFFLLLFIPLSAKAASSEYDQKFLEMVSFSKSMPDNFDFLHFRDLFSKTSIYEPYNLTPNIAFDEYFEKSRNGDDAFLPKMSAYVMKSYAVGPVHNRAALVYKNLGQLEKYKYHQWMGEGLTKALIKSGHPLHRENPPKVLLVAEEYMIARHFLEEKPTQQRVENIDFKMYDVLTGISKEGQKIDLWFDTGYIWSAKNADNKRKCMC